MRSPGDIDDNCGRVLVLYRIAPKELESLLPAGTRPNEIGGSALAGIALIRRRRLRHPIVPDRFAESNSAVHFINVLREAGGSPVAGAYVTRYDTSSRLRVWMGGGRGGQGRYAHHARFHVQQSPEVIEFTGKSDDRVMYLTLRARVVDAMPVTSVFRTPQQALDYLLRGLRRLDVARRELFRTTRTRREDGLRLQPLKVERLESSFFEDTHHFTRGTVEFDSAFWLRDEVFSWGKQRTPCCDAAPT